MPEREIKHYSVERVSKTSSRIVYDHKVIWSQYGEHRVPVELFKSVAAMRKTNDSTGYEIGKVLTDLAATWIPYKSTDRKQFLDLTEVLDYIEQGQKVAKLQQLSN